MKNPTTILTYLCIIGTLIVFTNCNEEERKSKSNLVGTWIVTTADYDAYVGSMTVEEYYLNQLGYTQAQTDIAMTLFDDEVTMYLESSKIEFESTHDYWTNIASPAGDDGMWSINDSETMIILDEGTIWETPVTVHTLTSTSLNISFSMVEELDLDEDPETEDVTVTFDITLALTK